MQCMASADAHTSRPDASRKACVELSVSQGQPKIVGRVDTCNRRASLVALCRPSPTRDLATFRQSSFPKLQLRGGLLEMYFALM